MKSLKWKIRTCTSINVNGVIFSDLKTELFDDIKVNRWNRQTAWPVFYIQKGTNEKR